MNCQEGASAVKKKGKKGPSAWVKLGWLSFFVSSRNNLPRLFEQRLINYDLKTNWLTQKKVIFHSGVMMRSWQDKGSLDIPLLSRFHSLVLQSISQCEKMVGWNEILFKRGCNWGNEWSFCGVRQILLFGMDR